MRVCPRHPKGYPCTCGMGNLYRFVEPVLLFLLKSHGPSYGYELVSKVPALALTDATIESAALYRALRQLEKNGCVTSKWDTQHNGPARRVYWLTELGKEHFEEWLDVLEHMSGAMNRLVRAARRGSAQKKRASEVQETAVMVGSSG